MLYVIKSETAEVTLSTLGAELQNLLYDGTEYLWQGDSTYWGGRAPVCFPICGAIRDGKATAFGKNCNMPRHGVARTQEFEVLHSAADSITFRLIANEETILQYPFHFELQIKYSVAGAVVTVEYTVINHGGCKMPFAVGGHPAFNCPLLPGEDFSDYYVQFAYVEDAACLRPDLKTGLLDNNRREEALNNTDRLNLFHFLFTKDAMVFDNLKSKSVTLRGKNSGKGVKLDFPDFPNLLLWSSVGNTPFLALEPWTGLATFEDEDDCLEDKRGMTVLDHGQTAAFRYQITLL